MSFLQTILEKTGWERYKATERLAEYNRPQWYFFVLIALSSAIASLGLLINNAAIIIGAMVIAPLMTPMFSFSISLLTFRGFRMLSSFFSIFLGTIVAIGTAAIIGILMVLLYQNSLPDTNEIVDRIQPNLVYFLVACFSGAAGALAHAKPTVLESITGIAISVAVIPPLAVTGLAIATMEWQIVIGSGLLYVLNTVGVLFGSLCMFLLLGFQKEPTITSTKI